ncbi:MULTISPECIES: hypothetical protein, partial [Bacteria]
IALCWAEHMKYLEDMMGHTIGAATVFELLVMHDRKENPDKSLASQTSLYHNDPLLVPGDGIPTNQQYHDALQPLHAYGDDLERTSTLHCRNSWA